MSRQSSQGTRIYVQTSDVLAPANMTVITAAAPTVITFAALPEGFVEGAIVLPSGTGWHSIDDIPHQIDEVSGNSITLADSDTSAETEDATLGTVSLIELTDLCVATASVDQPEGAEIDVTTMCDEARVIEPGLPGVATWAITGFWDKDDAGQARLRELQRERNKAVFVMRHRDESGVVFKATVGALGRATGVDQAVSMTGGGRVSGGVRVLSDPLVPES